MTGIDKVSMKNKLISNDGFATLLIIALTLISIAHITPPAMKYAILGIVGFLTVAFIIFQCGD
jgi:hypothetical protein